MNNDKIFVDGFFWKDANEKLPDYFKGTIVINAHKFHKFMEENVQHLSEKGYLTIDMKESKSGEIYFELNTWKPSKNSVSATEEKVEFPKSTMTSTGYSGEEPSDTSKIPF